jgi:hypothetical protein
MRMRATRLSRTKDIHVSNLEKVVAVIGACVGAAYARSRWQLVPRTESRPRWSERLRGLGTALGANTISPTGEHEDARARYLLEQYGLDATTAKQIENIDGEERDTMPGMDPRDHVTFEELIGRDGPRHVAARQEQ